MNSVRVGSVLVRLSLVVLLTQTLVGCGGGGLFGLGKDDDPMPPSPLPTVAPTVTLNLLWSQRPTRGTDGRQLALVPALDAGRLYVADARGLIVALAADSGRELWRRETGLAFSGGPAVQGERLALGTSQGELIALSTQDGRELWRTALGSEVLAQPRWEAAERLIVHTLDDSVFSLNPTTGQIQWRVTYPPPVLTLRGSSTPALTDSGIIVGLSGGKLVKLDPADGLPLWEVIVTRPRGRSELARIADLDADPIVIDSTVYVGAYNGDLAAVDMQQGEVLWRRELSAHAGLAADDAGLYVTDSEDQVWGAERSDGAGRWKQDQLRYRRLTAPERLGDWLVVGDFEGYLHLLDKHDGRLVGRTRLTKASLSARPLVVGNRVYVYAEDGTLAALTAAPTMTQPAASPPAPKPNPLIQICAFLSQSRL